MQQVERANLELVWDPGPAQADFGEADFYEAGQTCRKKYLTVSFPYSNDVYNQIFGGETKNLVLYGPVGIGKTHMAVAVGVKACMLGYKTKFYTVTGLVLKRAEAPKNGTLERLLKELRTIDLLILDEWGYVPVDKDGSRLLFRVISDSYESKSLILTTNLEFSKCGEIFTDEQMAAAMMDRLVHRGHLLIFEGRSYRMEHALAAGFSVAKDALAYEQNDSEAAKTYVNVIAAKEGNEENEGIVAW